MNTLRLILGDQLSHSIACLRDCDKSNDLILMAEVNEEAKYVKHHQKKIAFVFSAMRHFALELKEKGFRVEYTKIEDQSNAGSIKGEISRAIKKHGIDRIVTTHPGEYRVLQDIQICENDLGIQVIILADDRFLSSIEEFSLWAQDRKQLRMEYFYREMRKKYSILMDGDNPVGGEWNYDTENRQTPPGTINIPNPYINPPDAISREVITLVSQRFGHHFGAIEPFYFAVTRDQALAALMLFIEQRLPNFGDYQDAMLENEPWMFHSHLSFYLNIGLLLPLECARAAENAYKKGKAPLNAVEGFIRQIIGWREYVRGIYWLRMPDYAALNFFDAKRSLPSFYWTAETKMNCLRQSVLETQKNAYAHHIQRLMVLGNFALLYGVEPAQINEWFLIVYADAYEWVELPNVSGMVLFADGGYFTSKPYAASGNYINKMSNYCENCSYHVNKKSGPDACPFNYLYWDFLVRNRELLEGNPRIGMMYKTYDRMDDNKQKNIALDSLTFFQGNDP